MMIKNNDSDLMFIASIMALLPLLFRSALSLSLSSLSLELDLLQPTAEGGVRRLNLP